MNHEPPYGFIGALRQLNLEMILYFLHINFCISYNRVIIDNFEFCFFIIVFVIYFSNNFFDNIFKGYQPANSTKFINNYRHVRFVKLKFAQ